MSVLKCVAVLEFKFVLDFNLFYELTNFPNDENMIIM